MGANGIFSAVRCCQCDGGWSTMPSLNSWWSTNFTDSVVWRDCCGLRSLLTTLAIPKLLMFRRPPEPRLISWADEITFGTLIARRSALVAFQLLWSCQSSPISPAIRKGSNSLLFGKLNSQLWYYQISLDSCLRSPPRSS